VDVSYAGGQGERAVCGEIALPDQDEIDRGGHFDGHRTDRLARSTGVLQDIVRSVKAKVLT
jgi:hypothetical protein